MSSLSPHDRWVQALRWIGDLAIAAAAFYGSFLLRIHVPLPLTEQLLPSDRLALASANWGGVGMAVVSQGLLLYLFGFYDPHEPRPRLELVRRVATVVGLQGLLLVGVYFLLLVQFPRSVLLLFVVANFALLVLWRLLLQRLYRPGLRRVVIVGCGPAAVEVAETIGRYHWHGLTVAGFVVPPDEEPSPDESPGGPAAALGPRLGEARDVPRLLVEGGIHHVILASSAAGWQTRLLDSLAGVRPSHASVLLLPGPFESLIGRMRYRWVHDVPLIEVVRESEWRINRPLKRLIDVVGAGLLLLLALPLMAGCALAVRLSSPGPVLYRQRRVGRGRRPFTVWKFRTMHPDAERETGEVLAQPDDPRLTPIGGLLRSLRLDELPQLFNVLGGSMSLVGPRPERPGFVERYLTEVPGYAERFSIVPGLTGLAQVNGEYFSSAPNKLRYDLAYMANWSLWLDVSILFRTVKIVLTSRGN